jgi:hypothetical protein
MSTAFKKSLWDALADTLGFVLGGIAGRYFGLALGFDFFGGAGWDVHAIIGLILILVGTGIGRVLFRRLFLRWRDR